ncbi:Aste57867_24797 [Aphanomyces stellatus]|uniref:Aste57867_24797 protein n=1 Tax=Aphanomyces stellatus TaxID=120398 RepID=A0A485LRD3_9STRA|nr:hypothetical protein As57867_024719 [Aphanomyces stellatus]VFU01432.1 Aste57867_24797 [Aphanomyces stellatus]
MSSSTNPPSNGPNGNSSPYNSGESVASSAQNDRNNSISSGGGGHGYGSFRGPIRNNGGNGDRSRSRFDKEPPYYNNSGGRGGGGPNRGRGGFYPYNKSRPLSRPFNRDRSRSRSRSRDRGRRDAMLDRRDSMPGDRREPMSDNGDRRDPLPDRRDPLPDRRDPLPDNRDRRDPMPDRRDPLTENRDRRDSMLGGERRDPLPERRDTLADRREPILDNRDRMSDRRDPFSDRRDSIPGDRRDPLPDRRDQMPDRRDSVPRDRREPVLDRRDPLPDRRDPVPDRREPMPDRRDPIPDRREQMPDRRESLLDRRDSTPGDRREPNMAERRDPLLDVRDRRDPLLDNRDRREPFLDRRDPILDNRDRRDPPFDNRDRREPMSGRDMDNRERRDSFPESRDRFRDRSRDRSRDRRMGRGEAPPRDLLPRDQPQRDQPPRDQPPRDQPPRDQPPRDQPPREQPPQDQVSRDHPSRDDESIAAARGDHAPSAEGHSSKELQDPPPTTEQSSVAPSSGRTNAQGPPPSAYSSPRPGLLTPPRSDAKPSAYSSPRPGLLAPPDVKAAYSSPRPAHHLHTTSGSPVPPSTTRSHPSHGSPRLPPQSAELIPASSSSSPSRTNNQTPPAAYSSPRHPSIRDSPTAHAPFPRPAQPPVEAHANASPRPTGPPSTIAAAPNTPERQDPKRDEMSPLKPFLNRRGSLDHHGRIHSSSPKATTGSPSRQSPRPRRPSEGDEKHHRRKSMDEHAPKRDPPLPVVEETILEPPKPKEADEEASIVKHRPRLGWGQGLGSSPSAAATTAKRPRMGWGMGLVVTQVPSPKVQADTQATPLTDSTDPPAVPEPDTANDTAVVTGAAVPTADAPSLVQIPIVVEDPSVARVVPPPSPEAVDMEIDSTTSEDDQGAMAAPAAPKAETEDATQGQKPRKEDILASIEALDADIASVKSKLATVKHEYETQLDQPPVAQPSEESPLESSPSKKTRPVLVDPELMATVQKMMEDNLKKSKAAHDLVVPLGKELAQYSQPSECPGYAETLARARLVHDSVSLRVRKHKQAHYESMKSLATEYVSLKRLWRTKVKKFEKDRKKQEKRSKLRQKVPRLDEGDNKPADEKEKEKDTQQINHLRSSSRLTNNSSTQLTQMSLIKQIADVEKEKQAALWDQENRRKRLRGAMVASGSSSSPYVIPDMILDAEVVRLKSFIPLPRPTLTGMERPGETIESGLHTLEAEKWKNPWSDVEKCIYVDKFLQTPKNFHRIASFLQNKTTGDVISFYYRTKKVLDYKAIIREQQLRRRGAGIKNTWNCWQLSLCAAMALGVKFPDALQSNLLKHSNFRSHQAAHSILQAAHPVDPIAKGDEEETNDQTPMVFDLMAFLDDNMYTTGYDLTSRSVRSRFEAFRASAEYIPDPPPSLAPPPQPPTKKARVEKDTSEATASPQASRRKPTTPRPTPKVPPKKPKSRPVAVKKVEEEAPPASPVVKTRKEEHQAPRSPVEPHPPLAPLPLPVVHSTPPMLVPLPVPLTPRTTPPSVNSSMYLNPNTLNNNMLPQNKRVVQKWTEQEKSDFLKFFSIYGKDWTALTNNIPSKTAAQIKNYYQNYKNRLGLQDALKKRPDRGPNSGSNTPQGNQKSPTPSPNSPSNASNGGHRAQPSFQFPLSIQVPQEYPPLQTHPTQSTPASLNAAQHRLIQMQKELSRIQMQQLQPQSSMGQPTASAYPMNSHGSQLKLYQYSLQQQVQMLQMQMHQQSVQDNNAIQTQPSSYASSSSMPPRLNQHQPMHEPPIRYHSEPMGYYDRFKEESKPPTENVPLAARPLLVEQQSSNLPPLDPPTTTVSSVPSRMSFSSILNESVGSPQYASSPSASAPVIVASAPISRSSMSSILNRQAESPIASQQQPTQLPHSSHHKPFGNLQPPPPLRAPSSYNANVYSMHHRPIYHDHHHGMLDQQQQPPAPMHYSHLHHQPIQPLQQPMHAPLHQPLQPMQAPSMHQPIQPMPQSSFQPIQPMQHSRHAMPMYSHRGMEEQPPPWGDQHGMRYDEQAHRQALEKEAHLRVAQEEAVAAAANAAAAAARVEALQRNVARQEPLHLVPPRFPNTLPPQPFHLNPSRPLEPNNKAPSSSPSANDRP